MRIGIRTTPLSNWLTHLDVVLPRGAVTVLVAVLLLAAVFPYQGRFRQYDLLIDDFLYVEKSRDWPSTWQSLAEPHSVHLCPLFRLLTGFAVSFAAQPSQLRLVLVPPTVAVFCLLLLAVYAFLERETESPLSGLIGMIVLGFSSILRDTVAWHSSSQAQWSVLFVVLNLLAAQSYRIKRGGWRLMPVAVLALLAPCWWSIGIIAGPAAALYLILTLPGPLAARLRVAVLPVTATLLYLAAYFWIGAGRVAPARFQGLGALYEALRGTIETMVLRNCGLELDPWTFGKWMVYELIVSVIAFWWFWRGARRQLSWLGISIWIMSYGLIYGYSEAYGIHHSGRYQVAAQLALVLFLCGGLRNNSRPDLRLTIRELLVVLLFGSLFWSLHSGAISQGLEPQRARFQAMQLGHLELMADEARRNGIGMDLLRSAMGPFPIDGAPDDFDGLILIENSLPATTEPGRRESVDAVRQRMKRLLEEGE